MKRRLPAPANASSSGSADHPLGGDYSDPEHRDALAPGLHVNLSEKRRANIQIHPLHEDPVLQTLTPRSLARSVAELDALRFRVQELEIKLSQHEVESLPPAVTPCKSRLPPIQQDTVFLANAEISSGGGARSTSDLKATVNGASTFGLDRIASVPELFARKPVAPPLVLLPMSPCKKVVDTISEPQPCEAAKVDQTGAICTPTLTDPPSPTSSVISTSSPHKEQAKISIEHDGDASFAVSQRQRLYQILKRVSAVISVSEDDLVLLKKLVDAEFGDVITFLLEVEHIHDASLLAESLSYFLHHGSQSKEKLRHQFRLELPRHHPVWSIQYPLQKIARNLEQLRTSMPDGSPLKDKTEVIVLVASGAYNPIHMLHIRAFYVARQFVESNYKFPVVGAFISPSHDTFVRVKNRRNPHEMITKRHRLGLIEAAVASSSWIEVDKWEITRRRVLDYLSTLTHVREMCESHFAHFKFHIVYVCGCNTVVKLSHSALKDEGFGCITVCRPAQTQMVMKHLGKTLSKSTTIVEDTGVLPVELERATSFRVRQAMGNDKLLASLEMMVGKPSMQYLTKHAIPAKVAGREPWTDEDKAWRPSDLTYVEYMEG